MSRLNARNHEEGPNIIGNVNDVDIDAMSAQTPLPDSGDDEFGGSNNLGGDLSNFKDITSQIMRTRKNRSKPHF